MVRMPQSAEANREETSEEAKPAERREPSEQQIRVRAYEIWEDEGKPEGRDLDHWLRARWELENRQA